MDTKVLKVLLLLGSNSDDAASVLSEARAALAQRATLTRAGSLWRTAAWGFEGPDFVNQVIEIEWDGELSVLLETCLEIERLLGRLRPVGGPRYSSRRIDIDLLVTEPFLALANPVLELPHPRMHQRRFVLEPLAEHWGHWQAHADGSSVRDLLLVCADTNSVHLLSNSIENDS